jgi:hypothetical protein
MVASVVIKSYFSAVGYSFSLGGSAAAGDAVATLMDAVDNNEVSALQRSLRRPPQALHACDIAVEISCSKSPFDAGPGHGISSMIHDLNNGMP